MKNQYDKVGNRTSMTLSNGDVVTYGYDNAYQLISEVRNGSTPYALSWLYDEVGNRLTQNKNGIITSYTCNDANQLVTEVTGLTSTTYTYAPNGNLTAKTDQTGTTTWAYNYENRQISYTDPLNSGSYVYDASGRRIGHTSIVTTLKSEGSQNAASKIGVGNGKGKGAQNGQGTQNAIANQYETVTNTEKYILDGANVIADYNLVSGIWNLTASYVTPFLDQNLLTVQVGDKWYYMQDGLGSVRSIMKGNSEKKAYDYYAFGEMLDEKAFGNLQGFYNRYKFTSREWDAESANYYYRARYYTPTSGRFTARDPIEYYPGVDLYRYAKNNPVIFIDPFGYYISLNDCRLAIGRAINDATTATRSWKLYQGMLDKARSMKSDDPRRKKCLDAGTSALDSGRYNPSDSNITCAGVYDNECFYGGADGYQSTDSKGNTTVVICAGNIKSANQVENILEHELIHASQVCCGNLAPIVPPQAPGTTPYPEGSSASKCAERVCEEIQAYCWAQGYSKEFLLAHLKANLLRSCGSAANVEAAFEANYQRCCGQEPEGWRRPGEAPLTPSQRPKCEPHK